MKIVIIGASGTVGRAVTDELSRRHEVIRVGRTQGDEQVDITSQASVQALFEKIGGGCHCVRQWRPLLRPARDHEGQ